MDKSLDEVVRERQVSCPRCGSEGKGRGTGMGLIWCTGCSAGTAGGIERGGGGGEEEGVRGGMAGIGGGLGRYVFMRTG